MRLRTLTMVRRPPSRRGVPPRYQVFDRRKQPPMTIGVFYRDPKRETVVFEVYQDDFREFLKQNSTEGGSTGFSTSIRMRRGTRSRRS